MVYGNLQSSLLALEKQGATHLIKHLAIRYEVFRDNQSTTISQPIGQGNWKVAPWQTNGIIPTNAQPIETLL